MELLNKNRIIPEDWKQVGSDPVQTTKIISLAVVSVILLAVDWLLINSVFTDKQPIEFWVWPIVVTILWISATGFFSLVNENKILYWTVNGLAFLSYVLIMPKDLLVMLGGLIFVLLSLWFQHRVAEEERSRYHHSTNRVLSAGLSIIIYAWLIALGFIIYQTTDQEFKTNPQIYYDRITTEVVKSVELGTKLILTEEAQIFNGPVTAATSKLVTEQVAEILNRYEQFLPVIFTLIIIGLLRTFAFVFRWATFFINWVIFKILFLTGFFQMKKSQVEIEKLDV
jgi:hypothetical protein